MKIGLDIGTSLTKAVLFGEADEVLARHSAPTQLLRPGAGKFEVDLEVLVDSVLALFPLMAIEDLELIARPPGRRTVLLDSMHAQCGRADLPRRPRRQCCDDWASSGILQRVFARTHNAPFPGRLAQRQAAQALDRTSRRPA